MQKYNKNRLLCGPNLTILLYGRRQLLHLLRVTLYMYYVGSTLNIKLIIGNKMKNVLDNYRLIFNEKLNGTVGHRVPTISSRLNK